MKAILSTLVFLGVAVLLQAQDNPGQNMTILILQDGSRLEGNIISERDTAIQFHLFGGYELEIDPQKIVSRTEGKPGRKYFPDGRWITLRGYYSVLSFSATWGENETIQGDKEILSGIKLQSIHGYKFNRYFSLGIALGIYSFEMPTVDEIESFYFQNNNFTTFPIELDIRGYLNDKRITPYYALNAGYGIAIFKNEEFVERDGGLCGQLELGVRFAGRKTGSFQMGLGYNIQHVNATYTINRFGGNLRFVELDTQLNRLLFNFGWSF